MNYQMTRRIIIQFYFWFHMNEGFHPVINWRFRNLLWTTEEELTEFAAGPDSDVVDENTTDTLGSYIAI